MGRVRLATTSSNHADLWMLPLAVNVCKLCHRARPGRRGHVGSPRGDAGRRHRVWPRRMALYASRLCCTHRLVVGDSARCNRCESTPGGTMKREVITPALAGWHAAWLPAARRNSVATRVYGVTPGPPSELLVMTEVVRPWRLPECLLVKPWDAGKASALATLLGQPRGEGGCPSWFLFGPSVVVCAAGCPEIIMTVLR